MFTWQFTSAALKVTLWGAGISAAGAAVLPIMYWVQGLLWAGDITWWRIWLTLFIGAGALIVFYRIAGAPRPALKTGEP